jgi:hypothetical protein
MSHGGVLSLSGRKVEAEVCGHRPGGQRRQYLCASRTGREDLRFSEGSVQTENPVIGGSVRIGFPQNSSYRFNNVLFNTFGKECQLEFCRIFLIGCRGGVLTFAGIGGERCWFKAINERAGDLS